MKLLTIIALAVVQVSYAWKLGNIENPLIVGGERASIADFPHSLSLYDRQRFMCGAANVHRLIALTAAHCLHGNTPAELIELYGGSDSRISGGVLFRVHRYSLHPNYVRSTLDFDVAVIHIDPDTPLEGHPYVQPIPLPPACDSDCCVNCSQGENVAIAGWGRVDDGTLPEFLYSVQKPIMDNKECAAHWSNKSPRIFCTAVEQGRDSCNGDSGTGLVREKQLVGLVSFGPSPCGWGPRPAGNCNLEDPGIRNWILQEAGI